MIYILFVTFSLLRGLCAIAIKYAQKDYIKVLNESVFFTILFSFLQMLFLFIIPPYYKLTFNLQMFLYPALFAVFYMASYILMISALKEGPTSLTNVIYNFQSVVPIIAGLIIWQEKIGVFQTIGLILFIIVMFLFNQGSYNNAGEEKTFTIKWVTLASLCTLSVGAAIIFTKQYMLTYNGLIKEYLIMYNFIVVLIGIPFLLYIGLNKKPGFIINKKFTMYVASAAFIQNITNIIYMFYITKFKSAFFFPLISILSILSIVLFTRIFLKEHISKMAYLGIGLSFVAIYLLGLK